MHMKEREKKVAANTREERIEHPPWQWHGSMAEEMCFDAVDSVENCLRMRSKEAEA